MVLEPTSEGHALESAREALKAEFTREEQVKLTLMINIINPGCRCSVHSDGGKRPAAMRPIVGFDAVMNIHQSLADLLRKNGSRLVRAGFVNGLPGFITMEADGELQTIALNIEQGKITAIYVVRNPDKLRHLH